MYTYWRHGRSGDIYAVRTDDLSGDATGVTGPIADEDATVENYGNFDYDSIDAEWLNGEPCSLYEPKGA